jgi:diguanylate cyclase (GGDEF)-like protein
MVGLAMVGLAMVGLTMVWFGLVIDMGQLTQTTPRALRRPSGNARLVAYTVALYALGLLLLSTVGSAAGPPLHGSLAIAVLVAVATTLVTALPVHIEIGRDVHSFILHELPIVVAVLSLSPRVAVAAIVTGATTARLFILRGKFGKVVWNAAATTVEVMIVLMCLYAIAPGQPVSSTTTWVALVLGTALSNLVSALMVSGAICLSGGRLKLAVMARTTGIGMVGGSTMTVAAITGMVLTVVNPASVALTLLVCGACLLGYRKHIELSERYAAMLRLERFTRALSPDRSVDVIVDKVLHQAAELMNTEDASLVIATTTGQVIVRTSLSCRQDSEGAKDPSVEKAALPGDAVWNRAHENNSAFLVTSQQTEPDFVSALTAMGAKDLVVAPLRLDANTIGVLVGHNRRNAVVRMTSADLDLVTTMANHAAVILERSRLIERLGQEVTEREYDATHDSLTGLPNRAAFNQSADSHLQGGSTATVMLVDLNQFKKINDTMGHHAGDHVLIQIAHRLQGALPEGATVARLGGDEFAVFIPGISTAEESVAAAERLRETINIEVTVDDVSFALDAAIGVSISPDHGTDRHTLLKRADIAMYAAKERRGNPIAVFEPSQQRWTARGVALVEDLRRAIDHGDLWIAYQPKTSLADGSVIGVEALCRWTHPTHGPIRPDEFVALAEQAGFIDSITEYMLDGALRQCRAWLDDGLAVGIAVNIPAQSLTDNSLTKRVLERARRYRVPPHLLTLEVTESALVQDAKSSRAVMTELRSAGFKVSIDDFGTGYSSLAYLHSLPVDELKIDRAFVQRIGTDAASSQIVHVIVELAKTFGLTTVAEGIETDEIFESLRVLGVDTGQGYLMGKPAPAHELDEVLRHGYHRASSTALVSV